MKRLNYSLALTALFTLGSLAGSASAHQMWIESLTDPPRVVVRFGEFGDSVEKSPVIWTSWPPCWRGCRRWLLTRTRRCWRR